MCVGGLGDKKRGQSHVKTGAVGVEGVTGRNDQTHESFRAAEALEFGHQSGQCRFRRAGGEYKKNFVAKIPEETEKSESGNAGDDTEYEDDEENGGDGDRDQQLYE